MHNLSSQQAGGDVKRRYKEVLSQLCLVTQLNEAIALVGDPPQLCISIVNTIIEFTPAENCSIMLTDPETGELNLLVAKGRDDQGSFFGNSELPMTVFARGEGAAGWAAKYEEVVSIEDCEADARFIDLESAEKKVDSVICAPIRAEDTVMGVINCSHSQKKQFSETDRQNVALVADHCAILLEKAMALQKYKKELRASEHSLREKTRLLSETQQALANLREQLLKSERFATLGELLAGVAHELNNRIAPILIYSQMLGQQTRDEQDEKRLGVIEESAIAAKAILETLLDYSRPGTQGKEPVNLNQTLQNTLTFTEYKLRNHGIELALDLSPKLPFTVANEKQIAQVFLNIINNAIQAMDQAGGRLTIKSSFSGDTLRFTVSDTGPGIPEEIREKIFEPFYTTKGSGKGTGLGLSISRRHMEEHGGRVYVESAPGPGARFVVELPKREAKRENPPNDRKRLDGGDGGARILVVDDDPTIRDVIRDVLGPGYAVQFATDGRDATQKIEDGLFDLLVVDYHMPGLDGKELYEWIVNNQPSLRNRVLFSTGDIFHEEIREFIDSTGCRCLLKPFSTADLRDIVSGALNA